MAVEKFPDEISRIRVLLSENPEGLTIKNISEMLGMNRNAAANNLYLLQMQGKVTLNRIGTAKIYCQANKLPIDAVLKLSNNSVIVFDRGEAVVDINEKFRELLHLAKQDLIGKTTGQLPFFVESQPELPRLVRDGLKGKENRVSAELVLADHSLPCMLTILPVFFENGEPGVALIADIPAVARHPHRNEYSADDSLAELDLTEYICRFAPDGTLTYVNQVYGDLLKIRKTGLIGHRWRPTVPESEYNKIKQCLLSLDSAHPVISLDFQVVTPRGDLRWQRWIFRNLFDQDGTSTGYQGTGSDITYMKNLEEMVQEGVEERECLVRERLAEVQDLNRQIYHEIASHGKTHTQLQFTQFTINNASVLIMWANREGRFMYMNLEAQAVLGYQHRDVSTKKIQDIIAGVLPFPWDDIWDAIQRDRQYVLETALVGHDGREVPVEMVFNYLEFKDKRYCCCFAKDITERKRAEEALNESEHFVSSILESTPNLIYIYDLNEHRIMFVNKEIVDFLGYTGEQILSLGSALFENILHPEDTQTVAQHHARMKTSKDGVVFECEYRMKHASGTWCLLCSRDMVFLRDQTGEVKQIIGSAEEITERKKAEESLRESEKKYRTLIETLNEGIWVIDKDASTTFVNPKMAVILGYTIAEMIGRSLFSFMDDEGRRIAEWNIERRKQGIKEQHYFEFLQKDGTRIYASLEATPLIGKEGEYLGAIAGVVDITDRKRAEDLLHESENKFTSVFQGSPIGFTLVSAIDGVFVNVNDAFMRATGYSHDEVIGNTSEALGIFADRNEGEQLAANIRAHHYVHEVEVRCRVKAGEIRPCLFSSRLIRISGKPYILSTITDITARKQAEGALRESEEKFREIFENVNDAITVLGFTPDGLPSHFIEVNGNACRISGYTREELLSMSPNDLDYPGEWNEARDFTRKIIEHGHLVFERILVRKDGNKIPIEISTHVFTLNNQRVMLSLFRDITERKRAEEAIRLANRKLKLMSGITRHDINNQLLVLNGYVTLLQKKASDPTLEDFFTRITKASSRISSMIQFTREYEEIGVDAPVWLECCTLVDMAAKDAPLGQVVLKNELSAGVEVFVDPLITKVCYNLMDNAVRYGGKITTIRYSAMERDGNLVVICEDDGDGVPADKKEKIFERGFGKNTGLGLAMSREILDITGITIIETGEPGKGARFEMTVPKGMWRMAGNNT